MTVPVFQLLLDGAADRGIPTFDGQTPLQAASTPNLDVLAEAGSSGLLEVGPPGVPLHSPAAHGLLWGLELSEVPPRSLLEAHGAGLPVWEYDVVFFFYLVAGIRRPDGWHVTQRLPSDGEEDPVKRYLPDEETVTVDGREWHFRFRGLGRPNSGVALGRLDDGTVPPGLRVTDSDPFEDDFPLVAPELMQLPDLPPSSRDVAENYVGAVRTLIRRSGEWLSDAPSHAFMAPKWHAPAVLPSLAGFSERWNLTAATDTSKLGVRGLADLMGMETSDPDSSAGFTERIGRAVNLLEGERDFVHCHFPEPDAPGHEGDPEAKREVLERIDRALEPLVDRRDAWLICVTADHATPCRSAGEHGGDTVPILLAGPDTRRDDETTLDEIAAARGGLGHITARTLLPRLLDLTDRSLMYEVRRQPSDPAYRSPPGQVHPYVPD